MKTKTIRGYTALARYLDEVGEPAGYVASRPEITGRYAWSPSKPIYRDAKRGYVAIVERTHAAYTLVPVDCTVYDNEDAAEREYMRSTHWLFEAREAAH